MIMTIGTKVRRLLGTRAVGTVIATIERSTLQGTLVLVRVKFGRTVVTCDPSTLVRA